MTEQPGNKTSIGIQENIEGLLCYVLGWISGIVFYFLESKNRFVRFHALQSIIVFAVATILMIIFDQIPKAGLILALIIFAFSLVLWIILMLQAYQGKMYKLPWVGNFAEKQANNISKT